MLQGSSIYPIGSYGITHGRPHGHGGIDQPWNLSPPPSAHQATFWNMLEQPMYQQLAQGPTSPPRSTASILLPVLNPVEARPVTP